VEKYFVVVAGNMGSGKSTLVGKLSQKLNWQPIYEPVAENPYFDDFYRDKPAWAFHSQAFYLGNRLLQYPLIVESKKSVLQDRCVYEDAEVFAQTLYARGAISQRDWRTYLSLYQGIASLLPKPDLLLYLEASLGTLKVHIANRGRKAELAIDDKYLEDLQGAYARWIEGYQLSPVLKVPADSLDFVAEERHLDLIAQEMLDKLSGHETLEFIPPVN